MPDDSSPTAATTRSSFKFDAKRWSKIDRNTAIATYKEAPPGQGPTRKRNGRRNVAVRCDSEDSSDTLEITRLRQGQGPARATP
jgi:hypothetical protein